MMKEVIDNAIDEFIMGHGKKVQIELDEVSMSIRDHGRGIPLGKVVECVSQINTGGKYNDDVFQFSVGLNGVGTKAVNALSSEFEVTSLARGQVQAARSFERGQASRGRQEGPRRMRRRAARWCASRPTSRSSSVIRGTRRCSSSSGSATTRYLNSRARRSSTTARSSSRTRGLARPARLRRWAIKPPLYDVVHFRRRPARVRLHAHRTAYGESYFSFVNGQYTNDGGTHQSAFREGRAQGRSTSTPKKSFTGEDVRDGIDRRRRRSSCRIPSSRARRRTSSARPTSDRGSCRR